MHISISSRHITPSEALNARVHAELDAIAGKYYDRALRAKVIFDKSSDGFTCMIQLHAGASLQLVAEATAADANTTFDIAAARIAKRLRRYRRRVNEHQRARGAEAKTGLTALHRVDGAADGDAAARPESDLVIDPADDPVDDTDDSALVGVYATVIVEPVQALPRLSVGDAVLHLDGSEQSVLLFCNNATGELNAIYRRADGHVGWLAAAGSSALARA